MNGRLGHVAIYNYVAGQAFVDRHYLVGVNGTPDIQRLA